MAEVNEMRPGRYVHGDQAVCGVVGILGSLVFILRTVGIHGRF